MNQNLIKNIESIVNDKVTGSNSVSGGCISDSQILKCASGKKYFLKVNYSQPPDMFIKEANGLKELRKADAIRIPEVIWADSNFILLECIDGSSRTKYFFEDFGRKFAELHKYKSDKFGFYEDNYIGSTPQMNHSDKSEESDWIEFYFNKRILFQYNLAKKNDYADSTLTSLIKKLEDKISEIIEGSEETPCLLHGDLWGGNYIVDEKGKVCLIDPAVYYGHREADLAMTKLFGGFSDEFYKSYNESYPLPDGFEFRENIYKLYHVMNHLNLFGTGYYSQTISILKFYLK
ncbi:MAG: fructosamine kinase family protein [Ignavibacteriaceae bacterium]|nr:fructosamine kinase family protein [Ignavibacteriaceae bacterium]